jgi:hypothetical protein
LRDGYRKNHNLILIGNTDKCRVLFAYEYNRDSIRRGERRVHKIFQEIMAGNFFILLTSIKPCFQLPIGIKVKRSTNKHIILKTY